MSAVSVLLRVWDNVVIIRQLINRRRLSSRAWHRVVWHDATCCHKTQVSNNVPSSGVNVVIVSSTGDVRWDMFSLQRCVEMRRVVPESLFWQRENVFIRTKNLQNLNWQTNGNRKYEMTSGNLSRRHLLSDYRQVIRIIIIFSAQQVGPWPCPWV